ncbi:MAG: hypothetical protein ABI045_07425 [Flavobacteriales bacterium]
MRKNNGHISLTNEKGNKKTYPFSYTYRVIGDRDDGRLKNKFYKKPLGDII